MSIQFSISSWGVACVPSDLRKVKHCRAQPKNGRKTSRLNNPIESLRLVRGSRGSYVRENCPPESG